MTSRGQSASSPLHYPLRIAIVGMGGFAASHHEAVRMLEGSGLCKLICTCDPARASFMDKMSVLDFAGRDIKVFDNYIDMLDAKHSSLDMVTIPTPVPLHAEMHRECVERGLPVYLEKPPTLDYRELDEMLAIERRATFLTNVGFNFIVEPERLALKSRLMAGDFGHVRTVCFAGLWPRPRSYFERAAWAARLKLDGRLVLDSCMGNAMAHYVHNLLFWSGLDSLYSWSEVLNVTAELYRAHAIEGPDTIFLRAQTSSGVEIEAALTHACDGAHRHREVIVCDRATITYVTFQDYRIEWNDGWTESHAVQSVSLADNLRAYFSYLCRESARPATRLVDCRPFVHLNDLVYVASGGITTIPQQYLSVQPAPDGASELVAIENIDEVFRTFFSYHRFPSQQNLPWAKPGGSADASLLARLDQVIDSISLA